MYKSTFRRPPHIHHPTLFSAFFSLPQYIHTNRLLPGLYKMRTSTSLLSILTTATIISASPLATRQEETCPVTDINYRCVSLQLRDFLDRGFIDTSKGVTGCLGGNIERSAVSLFPLSIQTCISTNSLQLCKCADSSLVGKEIKPFLDQYRVCDDIEAVSASLLVTRQEPPCSFTKKNLECVRTLGSDRKISHTFAELKISHCLGNGLSDVGFFFLLTGNRFPTSIILFHLAFM